MSLPILIRRGRRRDISFITNSWLKSFRDAHWVRGAPNTVYYGYQHRIIQQLLPRSVVLVAVNEGDTDQILGYVVAEVVRAGAEDSEDRALVVHYVYTKHPFRRLGIARRLIETMQATEQPIVTMFTHKTAVVGKMDTRKHGLVYNPYLALTSWEESSLEEPDASL